MLLVDDSPLTRRLVEAVLRSAGCEVDAAASPDAAVRLADRDRPEVVILDRDLGLTRPGTDLAPLIKSLVPQCSVLVYSGCLGDVATWPGVDAVLDKQAPLDQLRDVVLGLARR